MTVSWAALEAAVFAYILSPTMSEIAVTWWDGVTPAFCSRYFSSCSYSSSPQFRLPECAGGGTSEKRDQGDHSNGHRRGLRDVCRGRLPLSRTDRLTDALDRPANRLADGHCAGPDAGLLRVGGYPRDGVVPLRPLWTPTLLALIARQRLSEEVAHKSPAVESSSGWM